MKYAIFYFSPCGGTKSVADIISKELGDAPMQELTTPSMNTAIDHDTLTFFCFPVYGGRIPKPMYDRMKIISGDKTPCVPVAVFGNRAVDDALLEMSELRSVPCNDRIELAPMVEEVLADLAPLAEARKIALERSGDAQLIGSDTLVYRLVFNLVENAIRYSRSDTAVRVSTCEEGGRVILRVEDSGPGIPEQFKESIFQPFFRVDSSRSREYGGVGLGLSLVWEIAALHGGTVEVEASSADGTVMRVELPVGEAAATA